MKVLRALPLAALLLVALSGDGRADSLPTNSSVSRESELGVDEVRQEPYPPKQYRRNVSKISSFEGIIFEGWLDSLQLQGCLQLRG